MSRGFQASFEQALALRASGRLAEAVAAYDEALAARPASPEAHFNRGNALQALGRHAEAVAAYDRLLALHPRDAEALNNRAVSLEQLGRPEEALASCAAALAVRPDYAAALHNRGNALMALDRLDEALASIAQAIALQPRQPAVLCSQGRALQRAGRHAQALASFDAALRLRPDDPATLCDRGNALAGVGRHEEAIASYQAALALAPGDPEVLWNEALARLALGDYAGGWPLYESRWRVPSLALAPRAGGKPRWQGSEDLAGRGVLLHAEQGFGDAIQFVRHAREVAARGAEVTVACAPALKRLFARADGVARVVVAGREMPAFDFHAPLMSLPLALGTTLATIPPPPYLSAEPACVRAWCERLPRGARKVGLAWSGNPAFPAARLKACPPGLLARLAATPGCRFVSLQLGEARAGLAEVGKDVIDVAGELADFADTAAVVAALDLVVTIDTAVAHLAGALGKPVWILLPCAADWRWLVGRPDSPWYPSARLYRQPAPGDWEAVLARVADDLAEWSSHGCE